MDPISFQYCFNFTDGTEEVFEIKLNRKDLTLIENNEKTLPDWTKLDFFQCKNCPLTTEQCTHCPLSASLVNVVNRFERFLSYNETGMKVITQERIIYQKTTVQRGVSAMLGLIFATSGCPHLAYFKPMARFHLPLASEEETIYRATSMFLLAQYFLKHEGKSIDFELDGLSKIYNNIKVVNSAVAHRLRQASKTDSTLNAIVLLDVYAHTIPYVIKSHMEEIKYMFHSYLPTNGTEKPE